jgi:hypothetical protein
MDAQAVIHNAPRLELYGKDRATQGFYQEKNLPKTPNEWFGQRYPDQIEKFGSPFLELTEGIETFQNQIFAVSINHDFFAGVLGGRGDLGHHVVYFEPEMMFYFLDVADGLYKPTTYEKLANLYRALLMKCAQEMPANVHKLNLFHEFRSDKTARSVVNRAKSILASDQTFFGLDSKHERIKGQELHERICRRLVQEMFEPAEGQILLFNDVYAAFREMAKQRELEPIRRSQFRALIMPLVRESFDVGLRNDLCLNENQSVGWKNVRLIEPARN